MYIQLYYVNILVLIVWEDYINVHEFQFHLILSFVFSKRWYGSGRGGGSESLRWLSELDV